MKIIKANQKQIKEIAELMQAEFSKKPFNEKAGLKDIIKSLKFYFKTGNAFIAIEKQKIIGVIIFKTEQWWQGKTIIIEDLAIKEKAKKQGIEKKLLNQIISFARKNKIKLICFQTKKKASLIGFYKKLGFKQRKDIIAFEKQIK